MISQQVYEDMRKWGEVVDVSELTEMLNSYEETHKTYIPEVHLPYSRTLWYGGFDFFRITANAVGKRLVSGVAASREAKLEDRTVLGFRFWLDFGDEVITFPLDRYAYVGVQFDKKSWLDWEDDEDNHDTIGLLTERGEMIIKEPRDRDFAHYLLSRMLGLLSMLRDTKNAYLVKEPMCLNRAARKRLSREGVKDYNYHCLAVKVKEREVRFGGGASGLGVGKDVALHTVQGHWAHYGEQYGTGKLFGRHEGMFWIPDHIRGDPDAGVIEKSLRLERKEGDG